MTKITSRNRRSHTAARRRVVSRGAAKPLLLHHRHSFKLAHHSHTSYPLLGFVLLITGIFSIGWTSYVRGDAYNITAVVPAAPLTSAGTITSPADGTKSIIDIVTIGGNCPATSYVKLFRNQNFAGTGICQHDGTWSIQTSLLIGNNYFEAQAYNVTNQPGPRANGISIYYLPPAATSPVTSKSTQTAKGAPLLLGSNFSYQGYFSNQLSKWPLTITGGVAPYNVQIDWGDSQTDIEAIDNAGEFALSHSYSQAGGYRNSYIIKITARDSIGQTSLLQLFTIISPIGSSSSADGDTDEGIGLGGSMTGADEGDSPYQKFWAVAGPTYVAATIAFASFWLGEHRGMEILRTRSHALRRPRFRH